MKQLNQFFLFLQEKNWRAFVLLCIVTFAVHSPVLFNGYNLDDELVTRNHRLTSKGISTIQEIYKSPYYEDDMGYSYGYRPTVLASFAIEHELFGESPFVGHFINLLLYALTIMIIFKLILLLFPDQWWLAFGTALLFSVHPIHTEVVASLKNRDELLSVFFALMAIASTIMFHRKSILFSHLGLLFFSFLSITSKFSGLYFILWIPPIFHFQKHHFVSRYVYYVLITLIFHSTYSLRQSSSDAIQYGVFLLVALILFDALILLTRKLPLKKILRLTSNVRQELSTKFSEATTLSSDLLSAASMKIDSKLIVPLQYGFAAFQQKLKSGILNIYAQILSAHSILNIDKSLFKLVLLITVLTWNLFVVLGFWALPWIWNKLNKKQQVFFTEFNLHILIISTLITATNIFTPFVISYYFAKKVLSSDNTPTRRTFLGIFMWCVLMFVDIFIFGDTREINDVLFFTIVCLSFYLPIGITGILPIKLRPKIIFPYFFSVLGLFVALQIFIQSSEYTLIFLVLNSVTIAAFVRRRIKLPSINWSLSIKLAKYVIGAIYILTLLSTANSWIEDRSHVDLKSRWESQKVMFETNALVNTLQEVFLVKNLMINSTVNLNQFLNTQAEQLNNYTKPVLLEDAYLLGENGKLGTIETNNRPLDFIENPIAFYVNPTIKYASAIVNSTWILQQSLTPTTQSFYYGYDEIPIVEILHKRTIVSFLVLISLLSISLFFMFSENSRVIAFGIIFAVGASFYFSGFVESLPGVLADRFAYISSLGMCIATAGTISLGLRKHEQLLFSIPTKVVAVSILVIASIYSAKRATLWKDKVTLMQHDIENVPNSAQAHNLLAHALMEDAFDRKNKSSATEKEQQIIEAEHHFSRATEIYPFFFNAWVDKGKVNEQLNKPEEAIECYQQALSIDSTYAPLFNWIGRNYELLGNYSEAAEFYRTYLNLYPNDFVNYDNLARVLFRAKRFEESIAVCEEYLEIEPTNQTFLQNIQFMRLELEKTTGNEVRD